MSPRLVNEADGSWSCHSLGRSRPTTTRLVGLGQSPLDVTCEDRDMPAVAWRVAPASDVRTDLCALSESCGVPELGHLR
jgi:hypothetical protein